MGVSAIVIEDKIGEKNSLSKKVYSQKQDSIKKFCDKIKIAKKSTISSDIKIFARIESLILNKGLDDALQRANAYINAGADGIMIHSKTPNEVCFLQNLTINLKIECH